MNAAELYRLIESPALLSEHSLPEIKRIAEEFPYFQAVNMLYLKNLSATEDIRFGQELRRVAVSIPDRKRLFMLIEGDRYGITITTTEALSAETEQQDNFSLIDSFLAAHAGKEKDKSGAALLFEPSVSSDYMYWTLTKGQPAETPTEAPPLHHQALIDSFIEDDKNRAPGSFLLKEASEAASAETKIPNSVKELDETYLQMLDESYFTETLARIYVKQRRYDKALQIIKNLRLKYPEKNIYFADQIRFLEKLIINIKK